MEAKIYNQEGKSTGNITLPAEIFGAKWNADLVHQVVVSMQSNARANTAHTKTRGEVRGGGIKPWRQKGTGRARHGSRRSPIWVGGGTTFGPRNDRNYSKKVNKKMSAKALATLLSLKQKSGHIIFVDDLSFGSPKTKDANNVVNALSKISGFEKLTHKRKNNIFITLPKKDVKTEKSFKNLPQVKVGEIRNINPVDLVSNRYFVIVNPKDSISFIQSRLSK